MKTIIVVAISTDGAIGLDGKLPWQGHLPDDMSHFRDITMNQTVIMGRNTWDSIPPKFRPLPRRHNMVLTSQRDFSAPGAEVFGSLTEALTRVTTEAACVIGGARVYAEALPCADELEVTLVHGHFPADTFFFTTTSEGWREVSREDHQPDGRNLYGYSFVRYVRAQGGSHEAKGR